VIKVKKSTTTREEKERKGGHSALPRVLEKTKNITRALKKAEPLGTVKIKPRRKALG